MGSLRNFYYIKYCKDFWKGTAKVGRRCRLQTTRREWRRVYYSVLQELFSLPSKNYCRKLGLEGNTKWNSFLHYAALHEMKLLPYALVLNRCFHTVFPAVCRNCSPLLKQSTPPALFLGERAVTSLLAF